MVGAPLAQAALGHAPEELLVVGIGPVLDVDAPGEAEPRRVDLVAVVLEQVELALQDECTPSRVDDPARLDLALLALVGDRDHVRVTDLDVLHAAVAKPLDAGLQHLLGQVVLEPATVELVARVVQRLVDPALDALGDLGVVAGREPPAQPELVNLIVVEMLLEPEHVGEVVRRHLDRRLSDLECRLGRRRPCASRR